MNLLHSTNKQFTKASEVQIPEVYNRRFKTGKKDLDAIFGDEGFLPGMTFTLAAAPGTGKTSFLIQILELLEKTGKKTAYISGEEGIEQLAFAAKRLNVKHVPLANMTDIDEICTAISENKFDFVVIDSLPALTTPSHLNTREAEEYIATKIVHTAKTHETVIGTILHFTKAGTYKGSTLLPHSVDCNMIMTRHEEDPSLREIELTKNRFGCSGFVAFAMSSEGFDFEAVEIQEDSKASTANSKKGTVLEALKTKKTLKELIQETEISPGYLTTILRELSLEGKIEKSGRGVEAIFESRG